MLLIMDLKICLHGRLSAVNELELAYILLQSRLFQRRNVLEFALEFKKTACLELVLSLESNVKVDFREFKDVNIQEYLPELLKKSVSKLCF